MTGFADMDLKIHFTTMLKDSQARGIKEKNGGLQSNQSSV